MKKETFKKIENFMLENCGEAAHDKEHIYRVLYNALEIAKNEKDVDLDILITACLLHDIGRVKELSDKNIDHAVWGSEVLTKNFQVLSANAYFATGTEAKTYQKRLRQRYFMIRTKLTPAV